MKEPLRKFFLVLLLFPILFLFMGIVIYLFMPAEEKYYVHKRIISRPFDNSLEISAMERKTGYLRQTILLNNEVAEKYMDFKKNDGKEKGDISAQRFQIAYENHPNRELLKKLEETSKRLVVLKKKSHFIR